jgi:Beta-galactosidase jelly roll domain
MAMKKYGLVVVLAALFSCVARAEDWNMVSDLRGTWKIELGDKREWANPRFDDSKWQDIFVPAPWEDEGFPGYDGYAWYRKSFKLPPRKPSTALYLHLGCIDDVSEVYLNGKLLGGYGSFPPHYETAYDQNEIFLVPEKYWNPNGVNMIAVRVYDDQLNGGIVSGKIGIFEKKGAFECDIKFADLWKFKTGDDMKWSRSEYDDSKWEEIIVPALWDGQGYRDYDGYAWYRVHFYVPKEFAQENLVLLLGKIDDIDEAYVNGKLVGRTGQFKSGGGVGRISEEYQQFRTYVLQHSALRYGEDNVLAVRVYDNFKNGGIYEGPVGIARQSKVRLSREIPRKDTRNSFEGFLDKLFNEN